MIPTRASLDHPNTEPQMGGMAHKHIPPMVPPMPRQGWPASQGSVPGRLPLPGPGWVFKGDVQAHTHTSTWAGELPFNQYLLLGTHIYLPIRCISWDGNGSGQRVPCVGDFPGNAARPGLAETLRPMTFTFSESF